MLFLSAQYYFGDYAGYGFGAPPYGYRWVRYGPDLLLVSERTGRIREVIYGVFY
jgi:Ni/Co efflux regulator RcnB